MRWAKVKERVWPSGKGMGGGGCSKDETDGKIKWEELMRFEGEDGQRYKEKIGILAVDRKWMEGMAKWM